MGLVLHYDAVWDCGDLGTMDLVVERPRKTASRPSQIERILTCTQTIPVFYVFRRCTGALIRQKGFPSTLPNAIISTPKISDEICIWRTGAIQVQDQWNQSIHELLCVKSSLFEGQDDYDSEHILYVSSAIIWAGLMA